MNNTVKFDLPGSNRFPISPFFRQGLQIDTAARQYLIDRGSGIVNLPPEIQRLACHFQRIAVLFNPREIMISGENAVLTQTVSDFAREFYRLKPLPIVTGNVAVVEDFKAPVQPIAKLRTYFDRQKITHVVGIDLGATNLKGAIARLGDMENFTKINARSSQGASNVQGLIERIATYAESIIRSKGLRPEQAIVSIISPGPLNSQTGVLGDLVNFPFKTKDTPLVEWLEKRLNTTVILTNDADGAAMAHVGDSFTFTWGTGIGAGINIDGRLYEGSEAGHLDLSDFSYLMHMYGNSRLYASYDQIMRRCGCGSMTDLEAWCGSQGLVRRWALLRNMKNLALINMLSPRDIGLAAQNGNEHANQVLEGAAMLAAQAMRWIYFYTGIKQFYYVGNVAGRDPEAPTGERLIEMTRKSLSNLMITAIIYLEPPFLLDINGGELKVDLGEPDAGLIGALKIGEGFFYGETAGGGIRA